MTTASQKNPGALSSQPPHAGPGPVVKAVAALLDAELDRAVATGSAVTGERLAQVEADAGVLVDPQYAQDIAAAAHAEDAAEIAERGRQVALLADEQRKLNAVLRLLEGRPGTYMLPVAEIAAAAEYGTTPLDHFPMPLTWRPEDGVDTPGPGDTGRRAIIRARSAHGQLAHLVVEGDDRARLASLVGAETAQAQAACPTNGCGTDADYDPVDMHGWARLEVAGIEDDRPRWYCSPTCVSDALTRAGEELAAADRVAAGDPDEQGWATAVDAGTAQALEAEARTYPEAVIDHRYGDPLAYGPSGIPCGCGKPAHSSLVPCQPDDETADAAARSAVSGE
ncbi:hypothetical protein U5640_36205 [Streptomyces sp. SS7]|uniref:hypothetical protein n=1 Tax=Streptomyces sp. SS7 TaxID=3108485 RepID=UPI0030ECDA4A